MSATFSTVREVIAQLKKLPQDAIVVMSYEEPWDAGEGQVDGVGGFVLMDGWESRSGWNLIDAYDSGYKHQLVLLTVNSDETPEMVFDTMAESIDEAMEGSDSPSFVNHARRVLEKIQEKTNG